MSRNNSNALRAIYNKPWLAQPESIHSLLTALEDEIEFPEKPKDVDETEGQGDTAIISISGVLSQKSSFWSGEMSTEEIGVEITNALENDDVKRIILDIDSPGGEVDGTEALSNLIFNGRQKKEIIAFVNSLAASAAYWIASAATRVILSSSTAIAGSIGVVAVHRDFSGYEEKLGVKTTEIVAGKFKRVASPYNPISAAGKESLQSQVDYIYSIFVSAIAHNRNVSEDTVLKNMADGRLFIGQQAVDSGLADGIGNIAKGFTVPKIVNTAAKEVENMAETPEKLVITLAVLEKENPVLLTSLKEESFAAGETAGRTAERERLKSIKELTLEGFETFAQQAIDNGHAPEAFAVAQTKEQKSRGITMAQLKNDTEIVNTVPITGDDSGEEDIETIAANIAAGSGRGKS